MNREVISWNGLVAVDRLMHASQFPITISECSSETGIPAGEVVNLRNAARRLRDRGIDPQEIDSVMRSGDRQLVAFHEAGHAVVAHKVGSTVGAVYIEREQRKGGWGDWDGNTEVSTEPPNTAKVGIAGPLAEAKCQAVASHPDARFDTTQAESLAGQIVGRPEDDGPCTVTVQFQPGGGIEAPIHDGDLRRLSDDATELAAAIREAMTILDEHWPAVEKIAKQLTDGKGAVLERVRVSEIGRLLGAEDHS